MKVGDLISFKPIDFGLEDWSNPCIVMSEYESPNEGLWSVTNRWFPMQKVYVVIDEIGEHALVACQENMQTAWAEKKALKVIG